MLSLFFALLLVAVVLVSWLLTLLGLPGNWLMVLATAIYAYLVPGQSSVALGWKTVVVLIVLAALGEMVELVAGAIGVARAGGSRRGAVLALAGSVLGIFVGMFVGVPIPVIGPIVAAALFAGLGAMAGAILGEVSLGRKLDASWQIGKLAFWGRLAGTLGKMIFGAVMVAVVLVALVF
jgi:uncharacterized protein